MDYFNKEEIEQLILESKTFEEFREKYVEFHFSFETTSKIHHKTNKISSDIISEQIKTLSAEDEITKILSDELTKSINTNIILNVYWLDRPKLVRQEKMKRLLG